MGKRGRLSLCLLRYLPVTISLEKHGELIATPRCSSYLVEETCCISAARGDNIYSDRTNLTTSTISQGRENLVLEKKKKDRIMRLNIRSSKDIQSGNIIDYTSRRKPEMERYQDCSWFQKKSNRQDLISNFSRVEPAISPYFKVKAPNPKMHFGQRDIPPWSDEYLEIFDDDDFFSDYLGDKFGEKENDKLPPNHKSSSNNYKLKHDCCIPDISAYDCTLKKLDLYDNMRVMKSTNLSDIIPISYHEKVKYVDFNVGPPIEVNEPTEANPSESYQYVTDSDVCDLSIGREETVGVEVGSDYQDINDQIPEIPSSPGLLRHSGLGIVDESSMDFDFEKEEGEDFRSGSYMNDTRSDSNEVFSKPKMDRVLTEISPPVQNNETDMKLELIQNPLENPVLSVSNPELDFMDLVNYINNEVIPDAAASPLSFFSHHPLSDDVPLRELSPSILTADPTDEPLGAANSGAVMAAQPEEAVPQEPRSPNPNGNFRKAPRLHAGVAVSSDKNGTKKVNYNDFLNSMSIAERVKTGPARKRSRQISPTLNNEEYFEEDIERPDKNRSGAAFRLWKDVPRKRKGRSKSRNSDSASSTSTGEAKSETDSYRYKRDRNNEASRRSRQKKKNKERLMYKMKEEAEKKNTELRAKALKLETMVAYLRQLLLQTIRESGRRT